MDQKQLTQKSKAEHPQTKTKTKNKKNSKKKTQQPPWYSSYKKTFVTKN